VICLDFCESFFVNKNINTLAKTEHFNRAVPERRAEIMFAESVRYVSTVLTAKPAEPTAAVSAPHAHGPRTTVARQVGPTWQAPCWALFALRLPHTRPRLSPGPTASASQVTPPSRYIWPGRNRATQPREPGAPRHPHGPRSVGPVAATLVMRAPHACCPAPRPRSVLCGHQTLRAPRCGRLVGRSVPVLRRLSLNEQ